MARRGHPPEFRQRVVALVEGGRKVSEVAAELEVSQQTIYTLRRQARIDAGLEAGVTTAEHAQLQAAKRRIRGLETGLGGSSAFDVLADADLERVVEAAVFGRFLHQGQICMSVNRLIVDESLHGPFLERFRLPDTAETLVPKSRYYVLGDNRSHSKDSRYWGTVSRADILGPVTYLYFSRSPERVDRVVPHRRAHRVGRG